MAQKRQERRRKTLIVGLGKTGLSCARYLAGRSVAVAITDSREHPPCLEQLRQELPDIGLFLGRFDPDVFAAAERLVVSPGVAIKEPLIQEAIAHGVSVVGDIELFANQVEVPVAAITGSNGKSTVTCLLGAMAQVAGRKVKVGGNLGEPALDLLQEEADLYVLELSSFQLETTESLAPHVAVVLNLCPDHLDRYASFEAYAQTKARIYRQAQIRVFNRDDPGVMAMAADAGEALFFGLDEPVDERNFGLRRKGDETWLAQGEELLLPADRLLLPGRHNQANALAALALGTALELPRPAMLTALQQFRGLPHRSQFVIEHAGVRWYNDSKGTNPGATIAALEGMHPEQGDSRTVLIAGGDGKGADFSVLAPVVARTVRAVVLLGRDAPLIEAVLPDSVPVLHAADMDQAVALAAEQARPGDRVLLSPACASFDMYKNYEQRGERFMAAVRRELQ